MVWRLSYLEGREAVERDEPRSDDGKRGGESLEDVVGEANHQRHDQTPQPHLPPAPPQPEPDSPPESLAAEHLKLSAAAEKEWTCLHCMY